MMLPTIKDATDRLRNLNLQRRSTKTLSPYDKLDGAVTLFQDCSHKVIQLLNGKIVTRLL